MVSTGHCHPKVVKAIQDQAAQLIHSQQNIFTSNVAQVRACLCPPPPSTTLACPQSHVLIDIIPNMQISHWQRHLEDPKRSITPVQCPGSQGLDRLREGRTVRCLTDACRRTTRERT